MRIDEGRKNAHFCTKMSFAKCIIVYSSVLNIDKVFIVNYEFFSIMHSDFCHVARKKTMGKGFAICTEELKYE